MRQKNKTGFTLIELLVVIGIIALLMTMVPRTIRKVKENAKISQARIELQSIENAVLSYFNEYGKLPVKNDRQGASDLDFSPEATEESIAIIDYLIGEDTTDNIREIVFLEPQQQADDFSGTGNFVDPWGYQYIIILDTDYDQMINIEGEDVRKRVIVASVGLYQLQGDGDSEKILWNWK